MIFFTLIVVEVIFGGNHVINNRYLFKTGY